MTFRFTVFTPTYNRAHTLPRLYESLKLQTFRDFEWLIVDDGSSDNTEEMVKAWQKEALFPIRYFWQENAHKKAAFNRGVKEAAGELFLTLDSDDEALSEAMEILERHWCAILESKREGFSAVTGLCIDENGKIIGDSFPHDIFDSDSIEIFHRYKIKGDKCGFHRTDVLRRFPFPEAVLGHVPEGIVWSSISANYKTRFVNEPIVTVHFDAGESITRTISPHVEHAEGHALWARQVLCNEWRWLLHNPWWILKMAANYTRFHLHLKKSQSGKCFALKGIAPRFLMTIMWPIGTLRYWFDVRRESRE